MLTMISVVTICQHTKILHYYELYSLLNIRTLFKKLYVCTVEEVIFFYEKHFFLLYPIIFKRQLGLKVENLCKMHYTLLNKMITYCYLTFLFQCGETFDFFVSRVKTVVTEKSLKL